MKPSEQMTAADNQRPFTIYQRGGQASLLGMLIFAGVGLLTSETFWFILAGCCLLFLLLYSSIETRKPA